MQITVVTGSTDGIGKAYATQLALKGFNIVLISRNPQKLSEVAKEISECVNFVQDAVQYGFNFDFFVVTIAISRNTGLAKMRLYVSYSWSIQD